MTNQKTKIMVIGLDGCTFDILNPLIDKGKLPNIEKLMKEGVFGKLRSTIPPLSPAAWSTFQTGKNPGKHGIFDFFRNDTKTYSYIPVNSTFMKAETFWERLSRHGKSVSVLNFLFTYPPKEINGYIISGKETPSEKVDYTFPKALKKEILKIEPDYEVEPFKRISHSKHFLREVPVLLKRQEKVNLHLLGKQHFDLFMNMFAMPDVIQHLFWRHMSPAHPLHDKKEAQQYLPLIEKIFITIDDIVGKRIEMMDENTIMFIMSDHGFCGLSKTVQLNRWLQDENLLKLSSGAFNTKPFLLKKTKNLALRLDKLFAKYDSFGLRRRLRLATREKRSSLSMEKLIDWSNTKAYVGRVSENGIYCNVKGRERHGTIEMGNEYEEIRNHIILRLRGMKDPQTGQNIFSHVHKREDIYTGPYLQYAPDIIYETTGTPFEISDKFLSDNIIENVESHGLTGKHHPDGILMVYGKGVKKAGNIEGASICDLAPTILYMIGEKVPSDMDGKILTDIFSADVTIDNPVKYDELRFEKQEEEEVIHSVEESKEIADRLKDLGYL